MGKNSRNSGAYRQDSIMHQFDRIANSKWHTDTASDVAMDESAARAEALARHKKQQAEQPRFSSRAVSQHIMNQAENKPTDNQ
jgi:hypothetical protein